MGKWESGESIGFESWADNEPNDDAAFMVSNGSWYSIDPMLTVEGFVCERGDGQ